MTPATLLNADMATLNRWSQAGWMWWVEELRGLVPLQLRRGQTAELVARPLPGGGFALSRRGAPVVATPGRTVDAAIGIDPADCLIREVRLPMLSRAETERLVALDADRLMPFAPGAAVLAIEPGTPLDGGRQLVAVAALRSERGQAVLEGAHAARIAPRRLGVLDAGGRLRFDFLPRLQSGSSAAQHARRRWWAAAGALFALNLAVLIGRDVQALRAMEDSVAAADATAATATTLRARVIGEDARRRAQAAHRRAAAPLALLAEVTRVLPDSIWVQRLAWDGNQLRLIGFKRGDADPVAALRRLPRFGEVRATNAEIAAQQSAGAPVDVTATVAAASRPRP